MRIAALPKAVSLVVATGLSFLKILGISTQTVTTIIKLLYYTCTAILPGEFLARGDIFRYG
jgi:hypothetical protein